MMRRFVDEELIRHLPVERLWRDQRGHMITEGTPEIMWMALARRVLSTFRETQGVTNG
jgi:alkylation response protein AidB-like acyl-CoA dehydrogenase